MEITDRDGNEISIPLSGDFSVVWQVGPVGGCPYVERFQTALAAMEFVDGINLVGTEAIWIDLNNRRVARLY